MGSRVRHFQLAILLACGIATTGCAVTSGLQTYDLPREGVYTTDLGTAVNVIKLTQDSMLAVQPAVHNIQQDYAHLFHTPQRQYTLSSGDILSIYLWAYPEITPPTNTISSEKAVESMVIKLTHRVIFSFRLSGVIKRQVNL